MSSRQVVGQLPLDASRRSRGTAERDAGADLSELRRLELLPAASKAVQTAYRYLARELDRARAEGDRYGQINAAREILRIRAALGSTDPTATGDELQRLRDDLSAKIRDEPPA